MSLVDRMFDLYIKATNLEAKPDFRNKCVVYVSESGASLNREDILEDGGFAGFCDAMQKKPNRFEGPKGTPQPAGVCKLEHLGKALQLNEPGSWIAKAIRGATKKSPEFAERIRPVEYSTGYRLGLQYQGNSTKL
jgi:hypothetical protein